MPCSKVCFASHADARRSASNAKGGRLRPYLCPVCRQYHVTSMTPREHRALRKRIREHQQMDPNDVVADRIRAEAKREENERKRFEAITGASDD